MTRFISGFRFYGGSFSLALLMVQCSTQKGGQVRLQSEQNVECIACDIDCSNQVRLAGEFCILELIIAPIITLANIFIP